jgi:hypothetical protein
MSFHPKDVAERYCGCCHRFHLDLPESLLPTID